MRAKRVDANQSLVVEAARRVGLRVYDTSGVGGGFPDLVVQYGGITELWEVKDPAKPPSARKLNPRQQGIRAAGLYARTVMTVADVNRARSEMVGLAAAILREKKT